jgi:hypothetical protein
MVVRYMVIDVTSDKIDDEINLNRFYSRAV